MKPVALAVFGVALGLSGLLGLTWIVQGNDFFLTKVFAPKYEQVRRETFEQSTAYNQGLAQELQAMQFEWAKAKDAQTKDALASVILRRTAAYDVTKLPVDLKVFVLQLRLEQTK